MPSALRSVIFDFGGVLTLPQDPERAAAMAALCGLSVEAFRKEYGRERLQLDRGMLRHEDYWGRILLQGGVSPTRGILDRLAEHDMRGWTRQNLRVLAWSYTLRAAGVATAILSNMPERILAMMREDGGFRWISDFGVALFSCEVRLVKPGPEIYGLCLQKIGAAAGECLFLDDKSVNVDGAAALGIPAMVFRSEADAAREISLRSGIPLARLPVV